MATSRSHSDPEPGADVAPSLEGPWPGGAGWLAGPVAVAAGQALQLI
jgi:hypothetical protein